MCQPTARCVSNLSGEIRFWMEQPVLRFVRAFAALPQIDAVRIGTRVL